MYVSGSKIAEQNSNWLSQIKPYNEIEIYVNSRRKSILSSMQAYLLGLFGLNSGMKLHNISKEYQKPPFQNDLTHIYENEIEANSKTENFALKEGLPTYKFKNFSFESDSFQDKTENDEYQYLTVGCPSHLNKIAEGASRKNTKKYANKKNHINFILPNLDLLDAVVDLYKITFFQDEFMKQQKKKNQVNIGLSLNYIHWFENFLYESVTKNNTKLAHMEVNKDQQHSQESLYNNQYYMYLESFYYLAYMDIFYNGADYSEVTFNLKAYTSNLLTKVFSVIKDLSEYYKTYKVSKKYNAFFITQREMLDINFIFFPELKDCIIANTKVTNLKDVKFCRGLPRPGYSMQFDIQFPKRNGDEGKVVVSEGNEKIPQSNLNWLDITNQNEKTKKIYEMPLNKFIEIFEKNWINKDELDFINLLCGESIKHENYNNVIINDSTQDKTSQEDIKTSIEHMHSLSWGKFSPENIIEEHDNYLLMLIITEIFYLLVAFALMVSIIYISDKIIQMYKKYDELCRMHDEKKKLGSNKMRNYGNFNAEQSFEDKYNEEMSFELQKKDKIVKSRGEAETNFSYKKSNSKVDEHYKLTGRASTQKKDDNYVNFKQNNRIEDLEDFDDVAI